MADNQLITYKDLAGDELETCVKLDQLNTLLMSPPRESWLKSHRFAKGVKYLPIEKVELLMTTIFQQWQREIKGVQVIANSVVVTVRVHYKLPGTDKWLYQDGVGACPLQTDSGASATDSESLKTNAVQLAVPAAASYAFKDACQCLGRLFGKDLNRKDVGDFTPFYNREPNEEPKVETQTPEFDVTTNF